MCVLEGKRSWKIIFIEMRLFQGKLDPHEEVRIPNNYFLPTRGDSQTISFKFFENLGILRSEIGYESPWSSMGDKGIWKNNVDNIKDSHETQVISENLSVRISVIKRINWTLKTIFPQEMTWENFNYEN